MAGEHKIVPTVDALSLLQRICGGSIDKDTQQILFIRSHGMDGAKIAMKNGINQDLV